jgi:L-asparaginase
MNPSILILYTGGTIGMKTDPRTGVLSPFRFDRIEEEVPELKKFGCTLDTLAFDPPIDSSDMNPECWGRIARVIGERYDDYDGFVVLHGTDTMSYSASALSFMLHNLGKPVVFTGSQIPIGVIRTDGKENLITAIEIAAARENGAPIVPEVCIYFQDRLFRANRTRKHNAEQFNAFRSENYPPLAEAGVQIQYNRASIRRPDGSGAPFAVSTELDTRVMVIRIFPGMHPDVLRAMLDAPGLRAVVLETYGSGNAPTEKSFLDTLEGAIRRGIIVLNVSQCPVGSVQMERYETGLRLRQIGAIGGADITTEAALAKLMCLLGQNLSPERLKEALKMSIRGEITV